MKVLSVVGARPQFIKAFAVSRAIRPKFEEILVHTGQHYDEELSDVFFEELGLHHPDHNLGVGSASHGVQTADIMIYMEELVNEHEPDVVLCYGDTNSTLATAIVASKCSAELAHVESGLRSYNREMPEEINRVLTDRASDVLFAPSEQAVETLRDEGITEGVHFSGDVMYDTLLAVRDQAVKQSSIVTDLDLSDQEYVLSTIHRPRNTDNVERLRKVVETLAADKRDVVFPAHPRTLNKLETYDLLSEVRSELTMIDPVGYFDFVRLMDEASVIATDSGGIQKEAMFLQTPCITFREETEWNETVETGWNVLVDADPKQISNALLTHSAGRTDVKPYGDGTAAEQIRTVLKERHG